MLSSCGPWAQLLCSMWDLPRPGIEPVSLSCTGRQILDHWATREGLDFFPKDSLASPQKGKDPVLSCRPSWSGTVSDGRKGQSGWNQWWCLDEGNLLESVQCPQCVDVGWCIHIRWNNREVWTQWGSLIYQWLWCLEGLGAGGEGDDRGWDGWMASLTWWTWVWVNSGSWWWTGRPGVLRFMGSQRVGHDWATELNWKRT